MLSIIKQQDRRFGSKNLKFIICDRALPLYNFRNEILNFENKEDFPGSEYRVNKLLNTIWFNSFRIRIVYTK
jgi:hypothetical protein